MKDRPEMQLVGHDGNIYAVMGTAARILRRNGMREEADEMFRRVTSSGSYGEALGIVSEYVQTELSKPDPGILEKDDIHVDRDLDTNEDGIIAYIETWFDVERRFSVELAEGEYVDLYAVVQPETNTFTSEIVITRENDTREYVEVKLLPCEKKLIRDEMEKIIREYENMSLKEWFSEWKSEYGDKQKKPVKENRKTKHER